jgi:hypothetical protein
MPTLAGDTSLDGAVSFGSVQLTAANLGESGAWDAGNFTYGSTINFGDLQLAEQNVGQSLTTIVALTAAPHVTLSIVASNGNWTAYARTDNGTDNAGLYSLAFDVVGNGLTVTSSQLDLPMTGTSGFSGSNGTNGVGMYASQTGIPIQNYGKPVFTLPPFPPPATIATGTYTGTYGSLSIQPDYNIGQGFQTLNEGTSNGIVSNTSFDNVVTGSAIVPATWTGAGDGHSWTNPANWSGDSVPTASSSVIIPAGADVQLGTGTFAVQSLTLQGNATVDLQSATLFIDYGTTSDPVSTIYSYLASGYNGGAWNGSGIISSVTAAENAGQSNVVYGVGYADGADGVVSGLSSGQIEIMPTLAGDCDLAGTVTASNVSTVKSHLGSSISWDKGDFTYNGYVDLGDLQLVNENSGDSLSTVPNPEIPTVTLSISAFDGNWTAYAQTDSSGDNDGLFSLALDVVGTAGLSVTSSNLALPSSFSSGNDQSANGIGLGGTQSTSSPTQGVGLTAPVELAYGTYTGSGLMTVQPDFGSGHGFQTFTTVGNTHPLTFDNAPPVTVSVAPMVTYPAVWTGAGNDNSWSDPNNWSDDAVPTTLSAVTIPSGYIPQLGTGTFTIASLTLQGNAQIDLQSATLYIDYGSDPDPVSTIVSYLTGGARKGWTPGGTAAAIVSSTVASDNLTPSLQYDIGYIDETDGIFGTYSEQIEIKPTLAGDNLLTGNVAFGDFQLFSQYFGGAATTWDEGNFTYGSTTGFADFQLLEENFGDSLANSTVGTSAPTVTLTISASDDNWTAYAQTDSSADNVGLDSLAFDIVGGGGISVTGSQLELPTIIVNGNTEGFVTLNSNGIDGIGLATMNSGAIQNYGKTLSVIATGTYSGSYGSLTVQADYNKDQGFQTLNTGNSGQTTGQANVSFDNVIPGSVSFTAVWTGAGGTDSWTNPANWSGDAVPGAGSTVVIPAGADVQLGTGTFTVQSLTLQGNATLDLQSASLFIDYGTGPDPVSTIRSYLVSGYNNLQWNGTGIMSSTVASENASQSALIYDVGYADGADGLTAVPSGEIEIMPTLGGDAKMLGSVVFGDFQLLSQYFGDSNASWDEGDFNYNGVVDFGEYQILSQNFGQSNPLAPLAPAAKSAASAVTVAAPSIPAPFSDQDAVLLAGGADDTLLGTGGP